MRKAAVVLFVFGALSCSVLASVGGSVSWRNVFQKDNLRVNSFHTLFARVADRNGKGTDYLFITGIDHLTSDPVIFYKDLTTGAIGQVSLNGLPIEVSKITGFVYSKALGTINLYLKISQKSTAYGIYSYPIKEVTDIDGTWEDLTPGINNSPDLAEAVGNDGTIYRAWKHWTGKEATIYVDKYVAGKWEAVGDALPPTSTASLLSLTIAGNNKDVYLSYVNYQDSGSIHIYKYDGTKWIYLGSPGYRASGTPQIVVDQNDIPYLLYVSKDQTGHYEVNILEYSAKDGWRLKPEFQNIHPDGVADAKDAKALVRGDKLYLMCSVGSTAADCHPRVFEFIFTTGKWSEISAKQDDGAYYLATYPTLTMGDNGRLYLGLDAFCTRQISCLEMDCVSKK